MILTEKEIQTRRTRLAQHRQNRLQRCAASPCNETFTPDERQCWHIGRISQLCNKLQKRTANNRYLGDHLVICNRTITNQRRTLDEMNQRAQNRNLEIAALRRGLDEANRHALDRNAEIKRLTLLITTNVTPTPNFTIGDNNGPV